MDTEVVVREAFMDVFCDLMYGGGWMELSGRKLTGSVIGPW